jgi:tetratricopeptide (TPR) repeat protein
MTQTDVNQAGKLARLRDETARFPDRAGVWLNLSDFLVHHGDLNEAVAAARCAIALEPENTLAYGNLGAALDKLRRFDEALDAFQKALSIRPDFAEMHYNLARSLESRGDTAASETHYRRAIELKPDLAVAWNNLGGNLNRQGRFAEAQAAFERALAIDRNFADAHVNLAFQLLARGQFERGLAEFEWRDRCVARFAMRQIPNRPRWDGSPLQSRTLLVHAEQGLGDTIQFIRYLPLLAERGGRIVFECPCELYRLASDLASRINPSLAVVPRGASLPPFDVHCPLMSLPLMLQVSLAAPPAKVPYLHPASNEIAGWRARLRTLPAGPKIGLAWSGNPEHADNATRSIALDLLAPLARMSSVQWISLQVGGAKLPPASILPGMKLIDWTAEFRNFNDAALIANLDLIISVDTSVAHLSGALGRPTWLLLSHSPDWRWQRGRGDTPWYPTMRLFRQHFPGDWRPVVAEIAAELTAFVG